MKTSSKKTLVLALVAAVVAATSVLYPQFAAPVSQALNYIVAQVNL